MRLQASPDFRSGPDSRIGSSVFDTLPVFLRAALAQIVAGLCSLGLAQFTGHAVPGMALLLMHSSLATGIARYIRLPWWWLPIQFLFAPALLTVLALEITPAWFLGGFLLLALIYWSTYRTRVPLYLSGPAVWQALEGRLPAEGRVLDLGSGLGGPLAYLARRHAALRFEGIEAAPLPFLFSWLRSIGRRNLRFRFGSFWARALDAQDVVFAYLSPAAMPRLWDKVRAEMRPGSTFVSVEFPVPGVAPHEVIQVGGVRGVCLYVWHF